MTEKLESLLDLYGADLNDWPDTEAAQQARAAVLSDPGFRSKLDAAKRIDESFAALSSAIERAPDMDRRLSDLHTAMLDKIEPQAQRRRAFFQAYADAPLQPASSWHADLELVLGQITQDPELGQPDVLDQLLLGSHDDRNGNGDG